MSNAHTRTPLTCLCAPPGNFPQLLKAVAEGADKNAADGRGRCGTWHAATNDFPDIVKLMSVLAADLFRKDDDGADAIYAAARAGLPDMVQLLAELGGDVNTRSHAGGTPMLKVSLLREWSTCDLKPETGRDVAIPSCSFVSCVDALLAIQT